MHIVTSGYFGYALRNPEASISNRNDIRDDPGQTEGNRGAEFNIIVGAHNLGNY